MENEKKLFVVSYIRRSGSIKENITEYYRAKNILSVYLHLYENCWVSDKDMSDMLIDIDDTESCIDIPGEVYDDISYGGSWMYFDLNIMELKDGMKNEIVSFEVNLSPADISCMPVSDLRNYLSKRIEYLIETIP